MSPVRGPGGERRPLRLLVVEDREDDLLLLLHELDRVGYAVSHECVETVPDLKRALSADQGWELVVSDFSLPSMNAHDVLKVLRVDRPDLPCIVVSGTISEEAAVDVLKAGARDFVVKQRMARLVPAMERELREAAERRRLRAAEITLHETRERMQFALESVGVGFWEWEMPRDKIVFSEVQERLHGMAPGSYDGTFESFFAATHPDDHDDLLRRSKEFQTRGEGGDSRVEYRATWADGSVHWILAIGRTICDEAGNPVRAAGVSMDITGQKRLEDQFRQAQKMESIGNLAGGIAHDFNNLLTVISGCCDLAAPRIAADPEASESLEGIRTAALSATALTRQLLTFSRRQVIAPRLLDLNETTSGFGSLLRRLVEENVHIELALGRGSHLVSIDPGQIEQVLLNLVANARDSMPFGGTVTIATSHAIVTPDEAPTSADARPGPYVVLSVCDTGSGMSKEVQSHLFEPFFTTKPIGRGTGLGLATVYGIVKQNEGHIEVRSELGAGTDFRIHLPLAVASGEEQPVRAASGPISLMGTETVLIVEDNAPLRRLTEKMLQRQGYSVLVAASGEQARQICTDYPGRIPVVLMDVIMPGESGPSVGEWICQHRPDTRIIYTSGYTGYAVDHDRVSRSGSVFLQKPFNAVQLASAIRNVLAQPGAADVSAET